MLLLYLERCLVLVLAVVALLLAVVSFRGIIFIILIIAWVRPSS